ncbi:MAG: gamma-glutamylcyclotransferase family protein [Bacteroidota bacterium]
MRKEETNDLIFVYGTLRKGFSHPMADMLASHAQYVGAGSTFGSLFDLGPYPAAIFSEEGAYIVKGDVYRIKSPQHLLPLLDEYEGYRADDLENSMYKRVLIKVYCKEDELEVWGYTYLPPPPSKGLIPSGDYLSYLQELNP